MGVSNEVRLIGLSGIPEAEPGDDVGALIAQGIEHTGLRLEPHDVIVVTHKLVSKAEGRLVDLASVTPSPFAETIARRYGKDPRHVEVVLQESVRIVRMDRGVLICETRHGFICANAGVDASNVPPGWVSLLPLDPDASAARIRATLLARYGVEHAVIITDSFGRPWRNGIVNVAIGVAGMLPLIDYRGQADTFGNELRVTVMAVADELAAAAELVTGKTRRCPVVLVRGYTYLHGEGYARDLVMPAERDLFR